MVGRGGDETTGESSSVRPSIFLDKYLIHKNINIIMDRRSHRLPSHVMDLDEGGVGGLTSAISAMSVDKEQPSRSSQVAPPVLNMPPPQQPQPRPQQQPQQPQPQQSSQYTDEEIQHLASLELTLLSTLSPEMQMAYDELEYDQRLQALDMILRQHHQPPSSDDDDEEEHLRLQHQHQQHQQLQLQQQQVRMPEEHFLTIAINGKFCLHIICRRHFLF